MARLITKAELVERLKAGAVLNQRNDGRFFLDLHTSLRWQPVNRAAAQGLINRNQVKLVGTGEYVLSSPIPSKSGKPKRVYRKGENPEEKKLRLRAYYREAQRKWRAKHKTDKSQ